MKLLCDHMLGTLAKWLRFLGVDTKFVGPVSDKELKKIATSEGRVILTRDRELSQSKDVDAVYVDRGDIDHQLLQVFSVLELKVEEPMSRCSVCNGLVEEIRREQAEGNVPEDVLSNQSVFWRCKKCGKYYWQGSHWRGILKRIERIKNHIS
ncbi:MAG: Mut7-C RNAse domain-containing protein [Thermoplasmata archaeon]